MNPDKNKPRCDAMRICYCTLRKGHDGMHYNDVAEVYW